MTPQEAILEFQGYLDMPGDVDISREAAELAIAALEKQIPKKPKDIHDIEEGNSYCLNFICPNCNTPVIGQPYRPNYCKHCGQLLDWGE